MEHNVKDEMSKLKLRREKYKVEELERHNERYRKEIEKLQGWIKQNDHSIKVSKKIIDEIEGDLK